MAHQHILIDGATLGELNRRFEHPDTAWFHHNVAELTLYQDTHAGFLPDNLFCHYLEEKYKLAPARFTYWHPHLAKVLREWEHKHKEEYTSTCGTANIPNSGGNIVTTPEPSTLVLALVAILTFVCRKVFT